jgi:hypothetical protein
MSRVRKAGGVYRRCGCEDPHSGRAMGSRWDFGTPETIWLFAEEVLPALD